MVLPPALGRHRGLGLGHKQAFSEWVHHVEQLCQMGSRQGVPPASQPWASGSLVTCQAAEGSQRQGPTGPITHSLHPSPRPGPALSGTPEPRQECQEQRGAGTREQKCKPHLPRPLQPPWQLCQRMRPAEPRGWEENPARREKGPWEFLRAHRHLPTTFQPPSNPSRLRLLGTLEALRCFHQALPSLSFSQLEGEAQHRRPGESVTARRWGAPQCPSPVASLVVPMGWQAHQAAAPQVSKLQQEALEHVPTGGGGLRQSTETIWSPYGPCSQPGSGPFSHLPAAWPPIPTPEDPKGEAVAPEWLEGERAAGTCWTWWSTHHLAAGAGLGSALRVSRGIWVRGGFFRSLQKDFPLRSSPQHFCLFGSSALHTLSLAASQGWPQGPDYATSTISQPSQAGWGLTPNQRTPAPNSHSTSSSSPKPMFSPRRVRFLTRCRDGEKQAPKMWGRGKEMGLNMGGSETFGVLPQVSPHQEEIQLSC
ncbi:hypothetical protein Cadr_000019644 [Camelus dromedarius]|uniref:Uncharacterized protein n=1 Tax=Camelus dromedarius TaxID=9838 RepID=A0A5N4D1S7_CAMDR|nr:hypothetical protein Cadr_000019644 [Camelus dromedarius]